MAILAHKDAQPLTATQAERYADSADRRTRLFNMSCMGVLIAFALANILRGFVSRA